MKKIISLILAALFILMASSCGRDDATKNHATGSNTNAANVQTSTDVTSGEGVSAQACEEGLYIKREELFYKVDTEVTYDVYNKGWDSIKSVGIVETDRIPAIKADSGEKLAVFSTRNNIKYSATKVQQSGYCLPWALKPNGKTFAEEEDQYLTFDTPKSGFFELDGVAIENAEDLKAFANSNNIVVQDDRRFPGMFQGYYYKFLFSKDKKEIKAKVYSGTVSSSYTLSIDKPAVIVDAESRTSLKTEKTDQGYFFVDLSNLEKGMYLIALRYGAAGIERDHDCVVIDIQ